MDQHPIPQDVTGFQFKLVGSMTVKQFGFVAAGVVSAVILYYLPLPGPFIFAVMIKLFLIPLFGGAGFAIAFLPIEGRPIDVMAMNFVKAIFSPNQYVYHKQGRQFSFSTITLEKPVVATAATTQTVHAPNSEAARKNQQLRALLMQSQSHPANALDQRESAFLKTLSSIPSGPAASMAAPQPIAHTQPAMPIQKPLAAKVVAPVAQPVVTQSKPTPIPAPAPVVKAVEPTPVAQPQPVAAPVPTAQPTPAVASTPQSSNVENLDQQESVLEQQLQAAKQAETVTHSPEELATAHQKVQTLEQQVAEIHRQKQQLEQELIQLKTQMHTAQELQQPAKPLITQAPAVTATPTPTPAPEQAAPQAADQSHVHTLPQAAIKKAGLPHVPDTANVVVGIVKDPRGNILPNILVEVKDKEGNPVRAFKTNPLGQFASATPLATGIYTIELEDPKKQHSFDVVQIAANNQIMLPIEIISHDAREELRKQLFTN